MASGLRALISMQTSDIPADRAATLRLLVDLAMKPGTDSCWDSGRAETLLRNQSSATELRALGVSEEIIGYLWPSHER